jgi:DNA-binding beta-propeller fold protein YncE
MKSIFLVLTVALVNLVSAGPVSAAAATGAPPLKLIGTVPLPGIEGDFDHFAVDLHGNRLFLAAEEHRTVEVFDLKTGKSLHSITGFDTPHSMLYLADANKLYVIDGGKGGSCEILNATTYAVEKSIKLSEDADALVYDAANQLLYVGNGGKEAHNDYSLVTLIDTKKGERVGEIRLPSNNLEAMAVQKQGSLLYVNMREKNQIAVIDRGAKAITGTWQLKSVMHNTPMVLDEATHRLFVAGRKPGTFGVLDTATGKEIATLPASDGVDDMSFDPATKLIYLACAEGFVNVFRQVDADHYEAVGKVATGYRAKIGTLVSDLHRYYVVSSNKDKEPAKLFIFETAN